MALRPSPGVLDRRAQRTARRIPARLQRGAAAPRARYRRAPEKRTVPRARPARPRTRGQDADKTRRAAAPRDDDWQPRGDAQEAHPQGRTSRTGASGRHHRPRIHRIDRRVCVTQNNIAGKRRIFNLGKHNAGRMAELLIDHVAKLSPPTWRPARSSSTRRSTPPENTNTASRRTMSTMPHDRCKACLRRPVNYAPRHHTNFMQQGD